MQAKVFDPFFTTKSAGHGLGLAVVDGIVRGLGGAILLTSQPDKRYYVSHIAASRRNHSWRNQ
jgi:signal transduction histidine kinase